jgi:hypothetical protein
MRFRLRHSFAADPDDVTIAYADPALYVAFADLPRAGAPEVLEHRVEGDTVVLHVRWKFSADLAPAARAVVDPAKLTWIQVSTHDLPARMVTYVMKPDHYRDRFSCSGSYRFDAKGGGTERVSEGDLRIKALLVAKVAENAIVSGLDEQLEAEVPLVEAYLESLLG